MKTYVPWLDRDLRDLIGSDPDLVAIADALAEGAVNGAARPERSRRRRWLLAAAAALAVASLAALVLPWSGSHGGSLTGRALAAIGQDPVLHIVIEHPSNESLIDLKTGTRTPLVRTDEIWYDRGKALVHTLSRSGDVVVGDMLQTPEGGYTEGGPIYDCAWVAAHPKAATKARVSCNASGDNGTTPREAERPKPTIDPPLAAFLDGYRDAVARGVAQEVDGTKLDGEKAVWLSFPLQDGRTEEVALDPETYLPLYVRMPGGGWEYRIRSIESVPFAEADFQRPKVDPRAARAGSGGVFNRSAVYVNADSLAAAYPKALWAGSAVAGLPLATIELDRLTSRYGDGAIEHASGVRLVYGSTTTAGGLHRSQPFVEVAESAEPEPAYRWGFVRLTPPEGKLYVLGSSGSGNGFMFQRGLYVSIWASHEALALAAARALEPVLER
jgi:hypothetical protein